MTEEAGAIEGTGVAEETEESDAESVGRCL